MCGILYISNTVGLDISNCVGLLNPRGPDSTLVVKHGKSEFVFHRLSINDVSPSGMQPFETSEFIFMCNGEIYNHEFLKTKLKFPLQGASDCEIIPHLIKDFGPSTALSLIEGVFAFVYYDKLTDRTIVARDRLGVKSLYKGVTTNHGIVISSELKGLHSICVECDIVPPCHYYDSVINQVTPYDSLDFDHMKPVSMTEADIKLQIRSRLIEAVRVRCNTTDRPVGCFLSGGLDSSLVAALVNKAIPGRIKTFSVGLPNATDLLAARDAAAYIGSEHHELVVTEEDMISAIPMVIKRIESYDVTTVRASTPMVLLSDWIKKNFDTTVIFSGEGADELSGSYKYFNYSPSADATQRECVRLLKDLHMFDILRCDKSVSGSGLEARVPFLDFNFVNFYMRIDPSLKCNKIIEKRLLREAFVDDKLLPSHILFRKKEAFSDGCSSLDKSWFQIINDHCDRIIPDDQYNNNKGVFTHNTPISKESYWYRIVFEHYYPGRSDTIPYLWLPKWTSIEHPPVSARLI